MVTYSGTEDLLLGNIPTPEYLDITKVIQDAADEIDSKLGHIYVTPFNVINGPLTRPGRLLLKRINNYLATGRLILQVSSPEESRELNAYGWSLVQEANLALAGIVSGDIPLPGAPLMETDGEGSAPATVPLISNLDEESNVEAFYDRVANPDYSYGLGYYRTNPDRFVR